MTQLILRYLRPPILDEAESTRVAAQLHYVLLSGVLIAGGIAPLSYLFNDNLHGITPFIPASAAVLLAGLYFVLRRGKVRAVSVSIILIGFIAVTSSLLLNRDGIRDSASFVFLLLLILSSVFLGSRATILFGILSLVIILSVWLAEYAGVLETDFPDTPTDSLLVLITAVGFGTIFLRNTVNRIVESSAKIREQARELEANNFELQQAQAELQAQTAELSRLNHELKSEIAERERTEAALRQRQKLESISLLAGGVAHDFNNLLTSVIAQSTLAARKLEPDHKAIQNIHKAIDSARRGADLTRQLLAYAGHSTFLVESLDLNALIWENRGLLESLIHHSQALEFNLSTRIHSVEADRGQIQQILMNLVINASEAIEHDRGVIRITTEEEAVGMAGLPNVPTSALMGVIPPPGYYICLAVKDNGQGIPLATLEVIFDPFFTTKEKGHGLGLSATAGIVRSLGGGICVTSSMGAGSCFKVYLPRSERKPLPKPAESTPSRLLARSITVLIIDDEQLILESTAEILESEGYDTLTARSGQEGIAAFRLHQQAIDVVLLDVHMPGMNGVDVFHALRHIAADIPVIFSSGFTHVDLPARHSLAHPYQFLPKPYTVEALLNNLYQALGTPEQQ